MNPEPIPVTITRTPIGWSIHVAGRPLRLNHARVTLGTLEAALVRLYGKTHGPGVTFAFTVCTGDPVLDKLLREIHETRSAASRLAEQLAAWTAEALSHPAIQGMSIRDAAFALRLSHQRVDQLRKMLHQED